MQADQEQEQIDNNNDGSKTHQACRTFKIILEDGKGFMSRLKAKTPKGAANKALSILLKMKDTNGKKEIYGEDKQVFFSIQESTRMSKKSVYKYRGYRIKLDNPTTYEIKSGGSVKRIENKYTNKVYKVSKKHPKYDTF